MTTYAENLAERVASGELQIINEFTGEFKWLSNFYWHYSMPHTVEHAFQASKAGDQVLKKVIDGKITLVPLRNTIMRAKTPAKAKDLGRKCDLPPDWNDGKSDKAMDCALMWKFDRLGLRDWLVATGDIPLVEGNYWHDNLWGDCFCLRCRDIPGDNKLGLALMKIRSRLQLVVNKWTEPEVNEILENEERLHRGE